MNRHVGAVNVVRFTADGSYCLTGADDRTVKLWNPHKLDPSQQAQGGTGSSYEGAHGYRVLDVAPTKDKSRFASCGDDRTVFVWDVASGATIRRIQAHGDKTNAVRFNDDGTVLVTASYDRSVKCWDMRQGCRDPIQSMQDFKDSVTCLALTDGAILAGSVDGTVRTYDLRKGVTHTDNLVCGRGIVSLDL
ncbi:WD40-repeat-containing domain protein, partial [Ochromonadaceae sp. CCMP2298]